MRLREIMTPMPEVIAPDAPVSEAAALMKRLNVGSVPVCENDNLVGMVTDRDITVRAIAEHRGPDTRVREAMTPEVVFCFEDDDVSRCAQLMEEKQIRRLPVLDREKRLVGIVSLGDLAVTADQELGGEVLERVSEPAHPNR